MKIPKTTLQAEWYSFVRRCRLSGVRMTQEKAAAIIGVSQATLSRFINPRHPLQPSMGFAVRFCAFVGSDITTVCPELQRLRWQHG